MKKIIYLLFLLTFNLAFPDSISICKNGLKSDFQIEKSSFKYDDEESKIYFVVSNEKKIKTLKYEEFDYVIFGNCRFQIFTIDNIKKGYFVLAKSKDRYLISTLLSGDETEEDKYVVYILDDNKKILDSLILNQTNSIEQVNLRGEIYVEIKFYFQKCNKLMEKLFALDKANNPINNLNMLKLFQKPEFCDCEN